MDLIDIQRRIREFRDARDWMQFHNPKNLAISIVLEATELLEHFQWKSPDESETYAIAARDEIADEIADVSVYLIELADNLGIDLQQAILNKLPDSAPIMRKLGSKGSREIDLPSSAAMEPLFRRGKQIKFGPTTKTFADAPGAREKKAQSPETMRGIVLPLELRRLRRSRHLGPHRSTLV